jgi:hypothetical protein
VLTTERSLARFVGDKKLQTALKNTHSITFKLSYKRFDYMVQNLPVSIHI